MINNPPLFASTLKDGACYVISWNKNRIRSASIGFLGGKNNTGILSRMDGGVGHPYRMVFVVGKVPIWVLSFVFVVSCCLPIRPYVEY